MKIIKAIKNILINTIIFILVIIAILAVYSFIQLNILGKDYCNIFGYSIFQIATGSMSGTMEIEDIIIVELGNENIKQQDIITFKDNDNFITHRVLNVENDTLITKGDSNNTEDAPIKRENVIGKVIFTFKEVKIWKSVFSESKVLISLGVTVLLFVLLVAYKENSTIETANKKIDKTDDE